jgi:hypothetical protein
MYLRQPLGAWYDKAFDFATQAGAAITGATAGNKWGQVVKDVGQSFSSAVFGTQPPQPAPPPSPAPVYGPPAPPPSPPPSSRSSTPAPRPTTYGTPPTGRRVPGPSSYPGEMPEEKKTNWLLYGGLGAGAIVLYLMMRKPKPRTAAGEIAR